MLCASVGRQDPVRAAIPRWVGRESLRGTLALDSPREGREFGQPIGKSVVSLSQRGRAGWTGS